MNKHIHALLLALLTLLPAWAACQPNFDKLRTQEEIYTADAATQSLATLAARMTKDCPLRNTANTWIDSVTFSTDSSILRYYLRIDPDAMSEREFYIMKYVQRDELKRKLINSFMPNKNLSDAIGLLKILDGRMQWEYRREKEHFRLSITPAEVDSTRMHQIPEKMVAYNRLTEFVAQTNEQLPRPIAQELTLDSLTLDSNYVTYYYSASSTRYNLDILAASGRDKMMASLKDASGGSLQQLQLMRVSGQGFRVLYHDTADTGTHAEYIINNKELRELKSGE